LDLTALAELRERAIQACDESRELISRYQQISAWIAACKAAERRDADLGETAT
jgi:hypothetical protein